MFDRREKRSHVSSRGDRVYKSAATPAGAPRRTGFTLVEVVVAIAILISGIVAVAQLVPTAIDLNLRNRNLSTSLIVAQRELEQMLSKPIDIRENGALAAYNFSDNDGAVVYLGSIPAAAGTQADGCPLTAQGTIDFTQPTAPYTGYYRLMNYTDPVTGKGYTFDIRWNVITVSATVSGQLRPIDKRITIAARSGDPSRAFPPASLTARIAW
jgi:type II secretory pathway pseudopilin PulG